VRLCDPLVTVTVFQEVEYGAVVTSGPSATPSSRNWTPATTPELSEAAAVTLTVPVSVAPEAGAVIATVGGVVSEAVVRKETDASVFRILEWSARTR